MLLALGWPLLALVAGLVNWLLCWTGWLDLDVVGSCWLLAVVCCGEQSPFASDVSL